MAVWTSAGKGIRYQENPSRKHGKRPDRYWCLQYRLGGKVINEAVGWWSEGISQSQCEALMAELRANHKSGQGPQTLREMRALNRAKREAEAAAQAAAMNKDRSLAGFWEKEYLPKANLSRTDKGLGTQRSLLKSWLAPLAERPLAEITAAELEEKVVRPLLAAGRSVGYLKVVLNLVSVVWNLAAERGLVQGENPVWQVRKPKQDDQRERFLSREEAARLLALLAERSQDAHDLALLSLFCGLRLGECLNLTWADVDLENGDLFIKDTKNKKNRHAYPTAEVAAMLKRRYQGQPKAARVFSSESKPLSLRSALGLVFSRAVKDLGLNEGITDRRQLLVFHSLRHSFASWLVMKGTPLYTVSKLLGHSSLKMTERYAHLAPNSQRAAAKELEGILSGSKA